MTWLTPTEPYNPFTRRNYTGLTGWNVANLALSNLAATTQSLVEDKKTSTNANQPVVASGEPNAPGGEGYGAGGIDPANSGYGLNNNLGDVLSNLAVVAPGMLVGGPIGALVAAGRMGHTMISEPNRTTAYSLGELFGNNPPKDAVETPPTVDQYDPHTIGGYGTFGDVPGKPGPETFSDSIFGISPESDPGSKSDSGADPSLEGGTVSESKSETPADGGQKWASGGLLDYQTPGMADNINIGGNYLSGGEYIFPADVVSMLGDGNTKAGGQLLDQAIERLRKMKYGRKRQPPRFKGTLEDLL